MRSNSRGRRRDIRHGHTIAENLKLTEAEKIEFFSELDRLTEKLERYKKEPTLFTFEEKKSEL